MPRIHCPISPVGVQAAVYSSKDRRHASRAKPLQGRKREKQTDKESGFESCPNSPRAAASVETGHQCQCGAQKELRHQAGDCISLDCFRFIKKLGSGGYGSVVLVEKRRGPDRGALYALKITSLNRAALVERDILPRLQQVPYTTDLAYAFFTASPPKAFLALPYAIGKDLFSLAGPGKRPGYLRKMFVMAYPQYVARIRIVLAELSVALRGLHERRILYRDLKLENILVSGDGHIRLADFGLSRRFEAGESTLITGKTGTPDYMAPEVIRSSGTHGPATQYSFEADLWGLGVIAYELIVGQLPFKGRELADLEESILADPVELPHGYMAEKFGVLLSHEKPLVLAALSFVRDLLQRNPRHRLSAEQLHQHVLFRDLDWAAVESGRHDSPPFDIRRVVRELPAHESPIRLPSVFSGVPSEKKERREKASSNGFDNPAKYKNYHYCSSEFSWFDSDLESAAHVDSSSVPRGVVVDDDDSQWDVESGTLIDDVPGLIAFERAAAAAAAAAAGQRNLSVFQRLGAGARPPSPDSACGEETLPISPASPDVSEAEDDVEWSENGDRLPSHPESPSASEAEEESEDDADDAVTIRHVTHDRNITLCDDNVSTTTLEHDLVTRECDGGGYVVDMFPRVRRVAKRYRSQRRLDFDDANSYPAGGGLTMELASALTAALPLQAAASSACAERMAYTCEPVTASAGLPPKKRRRFLQAPSPAAAQQRVVVLPQPPLPPFSSLRQPVAERC